MECRKGEVGIQTAFKAVEGAGESRSAGVARLSEHVENFVTAVDFHLVHHREQDAETAFRKAAFGEKPSQIFRGKLVDRKTGRGIVFWSVLSERHSCAADFLQVSEHLFLKTIHRDTVNVEIAEVAWRSAGCSGVNRK